ncbi:hypothetical protein R1sor_019281 [Riccia sorocarpa]|uniref:Endonuclease/exonuclease/phosphatase domain-containing protein n=1 Tax=Riccia sorocarpa TaxID=122646 RepID=A0ABD3IDT1_9MARC
MSILDTIKIVSWNVNGLAGADRVREVKEWLQHEGMGTKILAIQELRTREKQIEFNLKSIMRGATVVVDYAPNETGGAALVVHESLTFKSRGVKGTGNMAWVCVEVHGKEIYVGFVYGPHGQEEKTNFLNWLRDMANGKDWILIGDWNMVLMQEDSIGPTPVLKAEPFNAWGEVEIAWSLEDTYNVAILKVGQRFMRQAVRGGRLDQSRLDRAYISNNAIWVKEVLKLTHDGKEALFDHNPVILEVSIAGRSAGGRKKKKDLYTKMDVNSMRNPTRRRKIQKAWEAGWHMSPNPVLAWELAWGKAREVFKDFHKEDRELISELRRQQEELGEFRIKVQSGATEEDIEKFRSLESKVRETELLEASILRRRSRVRWVKEEDTNRE